MSLDNGSVPSEIWQETLLYETPIGKVLEVLWNFLKISHTGGPIPSPRLVWPLTHIKHSQSSTLMIDD